MNQSTQDPAWLTSARRLADDILWPGAQDADRGRVSMHERLRLLAAHGLLGINAPVDHAGLGRPPADVARLMETLASGCGVTTFVILQHIIACGLVTGSGNAALKQAHLARLARGESIATVGYSQVRRPAPPMVRCMMDNEGYTFDGTVPWSTGWEWAQEVVLGGTLDDGRIVFVLAPTNAPGMSPSAPMPLCTMQQTSTVSVALRNVKVVRERHIKTITREEMARADERGMFVVAHLSFGATEAALRVLREASSRRPSPQVSGVIERIEQRLAGLRAECVQWIDRVDDPAYAGKGLTIRAGAISLSIAAAQAAVVASSGSANSLDHPAQRVYREAMLYSLTAQTRDLQSAMLDSILVASEG
jgi:alkylation response protein AidB-like acyl-CoA dehydrogenase